MSVEVAGGQSEQEREHRKMKGVIYLSACLFILSVTAVLSKSGTWLRWPQGEERGMLDSTQVEAASCPTSLAKDTVELNQ